MSHLGYIKYGYFKIINKVITFAGHILGSQK